MVRRALQAMTFLAAITIAGSAANNSATAHDGGCGYRTAYYDGYPAFHGYAPRVAYYPRVYPVYYDTFYAPPRHHQHNGISISFGF